MTIRADIYDSLKAHAGLSALVGDRIFPLRFPQDVTFPCVTYQQIGTVRDQALGAARAIAANSPTYQLSTWAETALSAEAVAVQVVAALQVLTGNSVTIYALEIGDERDSFEPESGLYRLDVDAVVVHS